MTFDPRRCFQSLLVHVQVLWELVLLGEPLVVMAPSPALSSEVVLALVRYGPIRAQRGSRGGANRRLLRPRSTIAPLRFCCDFRPYFTIHDSEFREYTSRTQAP